MRFLAWPQDRLDREAKMHKIASRTFIPAPMGKKLKHQDLFNQDANYRQYASEPYQDAQTTATGRGDSKAQFGIYYPNGKASAEDTAITRLLLPDMIKQVRTAYRVHCIGSLALPSARGYAFVPTYVYGGGTVPISFELVSRAHSPLRYTTFSRRIGETRTFPYSWRR